MLKNQDETAQLYFASVYRNMRSVNQSLFIRGTKRLRCRVECTETSTTHYLNDQHDKKFSAMLSSGYELKNYNQPAVKALHRKYGFIQPAFS